MTYKGKEMRMSSTFLSAVFRATRKWSNVMKDTDGKKLRAMEFIARKADLYRIKSWHSSHYAKSWAILFP